MDLFEFETVMDGGGEAGAAAPEPAAVEPAVEPPAEPEPFNPEEAYGRLEAQMNQMAELLPYLAQPQPQYQPQPQGEPEPMDLDPFDPDSFRQGITGILQEQIAPLQQALAPIIQAQQAQEAEHYMTSQLDSLQVPADPIGDTGVSQRELVAQIAGGYRYAFPDMDPGLAIRAAYQVIGPVLAAVERSARQGQVQELETLRTAGQPLTGNAPAGGVVAAQPRARSLVESAERAAAKLGIT